MSTLLQTGKLEEFGYSHSKVNLIESKWNQFIPYVEAESTVSQNTLSIVNETRRIYLKPARENYLKQEQGHEGRHSEQESKFLYLGVAPLQRIIDEMKAITTSEVGIQFDPMAARSAGLMRYCDYLTGDIGGQEAKIRQQKLQEILYS